MNHVHSLVNERRVLNRKDWLLLFVSSETLGLPPTSLDPVRIQKGMFLLSKRGPARDLYQFEPYNWGPFSAQVYADLDDLIAEGLVQPEEAPGRSWSSFRVTGSGEKVATGLTSEISKDDVDWLNRARRFVTGNSFASLLNKIYAAYPEYATRSKFRR